MTAKPDDKAPEPRETETGAFALAPLVAWTASIGFAAAFLFVAFPQIDLWVAGLFYSEGGGFAFTESQVAIAVRLLFTVFFVLAAGAAFVGLMVCLFTRRRPFGLAFPAWLFLVASVVVGPGLITNAVFKDHWGRARPYSVTQFGGQSEFTPVLVRSDQCPRNCSFVGGESSAIYIVFFAAALAYARKRRLLIGAGIVAGTLAGLVRMGQGAHFLSDILLSGVFMMLVALALHWLMARRFAATFAEAGPVYRALIRGGGAVRALPGRIVKAAASRRGKDAAEDDA